MLSSFSILFVEDDRDTQESMKMLLSSSTREFYQAYNGEEGLKIYLEKKPDIVVVDVNMPVMDGLTMSEKIKDIDNEQPIIIMSAFDDRDTLLKAINIGVDYFSPKPVDVDLLNKRLSIISQNLQNKIDAQNAREKEMQNLYNLAHYDPLTQIANRFLFDLKLEQAISKARRNDSSLALFFLDLDNFKNINDTYGHDAGDKVLQSLANNIKKIIRTEDTFARISGDEFLMIVEDIDDRKDLEILATKVLKASLQPIFFKEKELNIGCSIGISRFPKDARAKKELIYLADVAMYKAKKSGKSSYAFYSED